MTNAARLEVRERNEEGPRETTRGPSRL